VHFEPSKYHPMNNDRDWRKFGVHLRGGRSLTARDVIRLEEGHNSPYYLSIVDKESTINDVGDIRTGIHHCRPNMHHQPTM
jgi:hypothetical protein